MARILTIENGKVKIGDEDHNVITVPISSIGYADPKVDDTVEIYKDGKGYIIKKVETASDIFIKTNADGSKLVNKHLFVWAGAFILGGFAVDRFIRGQIGVGICKIIFGIFTLGIWYLVDWIIALSKAYGSEYADTEFLTFDKEGNYTK